MTRYKKSLSKRQFIVLDIPLKEGVEISNPEQIVLKIDRQYYDIGSYCFKVRSALARNRGQPCLVNQSSLSISRLNFIKLIIESLSEISKSGRPRSSFGRVDAFGGFLDYVDEQHGLDSIIENGSFAAVFLQYAEWIKGQYPSSGFKPSTHNNKISHALPLMRQFLEDESFGKEIRYLSTLDPNRGTAPAEEKNFGHVLSVAQSLFDGLSDLLVNNLPFPYQLNLPQSLNWDVGNKLWIFPTKHWFIAPHNWHNFRDENDAFKGPYDYENGVLNTIKNQETLSKEILHSRLSSLKSAQSMINRANSNHRDPKRIQLARCAYSCFLILFLANTGCNLAVAKEIETEGEIDSNVINQSFRGIKYRANNSIITIRIPVSFMPSLRKYMNFRKYLLGTYDTKNLFFSVGYGNRSFSISDLVEGPLENLYLLFKRIDPSITSIGPRQIRSTVNDWLLRNHDVSTTANIMGHSEGVELTKYGRGSPVTQMRDLSELLEKISDTAKKQKIVESRSQLTNSTTVASGGVCSNYGKPVRLSELDILEPNCKSGCWFCANRLVVADEEDVRKITSATYVLEHLITSPRHETFIRPIIAKCEEDLKSISAFLKDDDLVSRVKDEVYEQGELTDYWTAKYHQYKELKVLV